MKNPKIEILLTLANLNKGINYSSEIQAFLENELRKNLYNTETKKVVKHNQEMNLQL